MLIADNDIVATVITDKDGKHQGVLLGREQGGTYSWLTLLDAEGEVVFNAPPIDDGDSGQGDGLDLKKV